MAEEGKKQEISWWKYELFTKCPQWYHWYHVQKKKPTHPENKIHTIYGLVVQGLWEQLIKEKWYKDQDLGHANLLQLLPQKMEEHLKDTHVIWTPEITRASVETEIRSQIFGNLKVWQENNWLKDGVLAELELSTPWEDVILEGRADFVVPETKQGLIIVDGKGGKRKYVNPNQLKWYALSYRLKYGERVARLYHYYWREQAPSVVRGWCEEEEHRWEEELRATVKRLVGGDTKATPSENCRFCPFKPICLEYQAWSRNREGTDLETRDIGGKDNFLLV